MKNLGFCVTAAACVIGGLGLLEAASDPQGRGSQPATNPTLCRDEAGLEYSRNSLRKVNGQIQVCNGGNRWIASPNDDTRDSRVVAAAKGKKDCIGAHEEAYESGLYRQGEKVFERCENGAWIPERE